MGYIGIDIGTTSICGVLLDKQKLLKCITKENKAHIPGKSEREKLQDPAIIKETVLEILDILFGTGEVIEGIGVTGQMHGILYADQTGKAVSPLYSWQDQSGEERKSEEESCSQYLSRITGYKMASGYGLTTLYVHQGKGTIPETAYKIVTVQEYIVWSLIRKEPKIHVTNAASMGLFRLDQNRFDEEALEKAGIDRKYLPVVTNQEEIAGYFRRTPVSLAIGDNQAAFLGSIGEQKGKLLVNIGTGSQISVEISEPVFSGSVEARPYIKGKYLQVGAPLCGGRAYAALKNFFDLFAAEIQGSRKVSYQLMDRMAEQARKNRAMTVDTELEGTRSDPQRKGKIEGIGPDNFTPGDLCLGFLRGTVKELKNLYGEMRKDTGAEKEIVMSGNGLRNSPLWRSMVEEEFGMKCVMARFTEEAACGAALYAEMTVKGEKHA